MWKKTTYTHTQLNKLRCSYNLAISSKLTRFQVVIVYRKGQSQIQIDFVSAIKQKSAFPFFIHKIFYLFFFSFVSTRE